MDRNADPAGARILLSEPLPGLRQSLPGIDAHRFPWIKDDLTAIGGVTGHLLKDLILESSPMTSAERTELFFKRQSTSAAR